MASNDTYVSTMEGSVDWSQIKIAPMNDDEIDVPITEENMCSVLGINDEPEHRKIVSEAAMKASIAEVDACVPDIDGDLLADAALPRGVEFCQFLRYWLGRIIILLDVNSD